VRPVGSTAGPGAWSQPLTGTPAEPGSTNGTGAALPLGIPVAAQLTAGDTDFFRFSLVEETTLLVFSRGATDTNGRLLDEAGNVLASSSDSGLLGEESSFLMKGRFAPGNYDLEVTGPPSEAGPYLIEALVDRRTGRPVRPHGEVSQAAAHDNLGDDAYVLELARERDLVISATAPFPMTGALLRADGHAIVDGDSYLPGVPFFIRTSLRAGVHEIRARYDLFQEGLYRLQVEEAAEPGDGLEGAVSLALNRAGVGTFDSPTDEDYFKFTLLEAAELVARAVSREVDIHAVLLDSSGSVIHPDGAWDQHPGPHVYTLRAHLEAGTYYLKLTTSDAASNGQYAVTIFRDRASERIAQECSAFSSPFDDKLAGCQWHLRNVGQFGGHEAEDLRVEDVWNDGNLGQGIIVSVVDDGLDEAHVDLRDNVDRSLGHDYTGNDDLMPGGHGTPVAGVIAARDNEFGGRGVAPRATIYGLNFLQYASVETLVDAMTRHMGVTAVSNNSWGPPDGPGLTPGLSFLEVALRSGVTSGDGGRGINYVFAAGNGHLVGDNANLDGIANQFWMMAACSVNYQGVRSPYSEMGANLWVCAPSNDFPDPGPGIFTTYPYGRYTKDFGGTSSAAPAVAGVVARVRAGNPALTWRAGPLILAA